MSLPFEHHFVWIVNWIWWTTKTATQVVQLKSHRLICMGTCKRFTKDKKYISRKLFSGIRAKPGVSERVRRSLIRHKRSARAEILEFYPTRPEGNSTRPEPKYIVCTTRPDPNPNIICPARLTRTRISSVLPDPDPNIARAKCILYFTKRCPYFTFSVSFFPSKYIHHF
jgi:hypothetical protein